ncbi:hypothetical protein D3C72_892530 [compost metagenome]
MSVKPTTGDFSARLPQRRPTDVKPPAVTDAAGIEGDRLALAPLEATRGASAASKVDRPLAPADKQLLDDITAAHFRYFTENSHATTGLTRDRSRPNSAASIAAVGFSLTAHGVAVHRGLMSREEAAAYSLKVLKTLAEAPQGEAADAAGHKGFFYHFLNAGSAKRAGKNELSTVDTALLMGGVLFSRNYFDGDSPQEKEIRALSTQLYERIDWNWATNGQDTLSLGWTPEPQTLKFPQNLAEGAMKLWDRVKAFVSGKPAPDERFIPHRWSGYSEGMLMVLLGMSSPTHPLPANAWEAYHKANTSAKVDGQPYVPFGPMFGHQYSHTWIDFRGIADKSTRERGFDWAENSRRAVLAQHEYARKNPQGHQGYSALDWGLTASDGPGAVKKVIDGKTREFHGYLARGAPNDHDDGTIAPTAAAGSLPFAPELVLPTLHHWKQNRPELWSPQGFADAFNPSFDPTKPSGWVASDRLGIDQGPIVLMTENYRSDFVWDVMKRDPDLRRGLQRAGFTGGWLDQPPPTSSAS